MSPHYYIMKNKKILRLEAQTSFDSLSTTIKEKLLDQDFEMVLDQNQANWRVVIFRDEILDLEEYQEWLNSPEAFMEEEHYDLIAN
jgi:hypothetical protein